MDNKKDLSDKHPTIIMEGHEENSYFFNLYVNQKSEAKFAQTGSNPHQQFLSKELKSNNFNSQQQKPKDDTKK
ncbi:hypothetical protein [Helicobacter pylori]|uniref:hypothetical protein n=1 Tax=Helicobacter pylori TaxID=210 RepID=UPI000EB43D8E|nr:hypothetical protein [Helicobacter pylori]